MKIQSLTKKKLGREGENHALTYLEFQGLEFIEKNYQIWGGEIDLIMSENSKIDEGRIFVFVEVKTRYNFSEVSLEETISKNQKNTLTNSAKHWLMKNKYFDIDWRFDIVGVSIEKKSTPKIEWIVDAFS